MAVTLAGDVTHALPPTSEEFSDEPFSDDESSDHDSEPEMSDPTGERTTSGRQVAMDTLVLALEPSEYGKMPPSYHSQSQGMAVTSILPAKVGAVPKSGAFDEGTTLEAKAIRPPLLPQDKYDGVDSDDETDIEDGDSEEEEEQPQVVGEIEIDMQEEEEEFIEFSRQALGISDTQWAEIVKDRKKRGGMFCI